MKIKRSEDNVLFIERDGLIDVIKLNEVKNLVKYIYYTPELNNGTKYGINITTKNEPIVLIFDKTEECDVVFNLILESLTCVYDLKEIFNNEDKEA